MIDLDLTNMYSHEFEKKVNEAMQSPIQHFERELATIRTGRAHPSLVENIVVTCYGSAMKIKEIAAISAPDTRLIVIQPWDKSILAEVEKAILASQLGITPINDGNVIRIQIPQPSAQRREELIKQLHKKLDDCRVGIRHLRSEYKNVIKKAESAKQISEDFSKILQKILQDVHDKFTKIAEGMSEKKEKDLASI